MTSALQSVLGDAFLKLSPTLRQFHSGVGRANYHGTVTVRHGNGLFHMLCRFAGFPGPMQDRPMRMSITAQDNHELWQRDFDGHVLVSRLRALPDGFSVGERLGPIEVRMRPQVDDGGLYMTVTEVRFLGGPAPRWILGPSGGQERSAPDGAPSFSVSARAKGAGLVIHYEGALTFEGENVDTAATDK